MLLFNHPDYPPARVTNLFDVDGDEVSDPGEAFTVVAELPNGKWLSSLITEGRLVNAS